MKRIALISKARCGTHFLKSLIPETTAYCTAEVFWNGFLPEGFHTFWHQLVLKNKAWLLRGREDQLYRRYFRRLFKRHAEEHLLCDIKIEQLRQMNRLKQVVFDRFDGFLILRRDNLLKMVISQIIMHERLRDNISANNSTVPERKQLTVDPQEIIRRIHRGQAEFDAHEHYFSSSNKPCYTMTYETLAQEPLESMRQMLDYFEIEGNSSASSNLKKQNPQPLDEIVINFDELTDALTEAGIDSLLSLPG